MAVSTDGRHVVFSGRRPAFGEDVNYKWLLHPDSVSLTIGEQGNDELLRGFSRLCPRLKCVEVTQSHVYRRFGGGPTALGDIAALPSLERLTVHAYGPTHDLIIRLLGTRASQITVVCQERSDRRNRHVVLGWAAMSFGALHDALLGARRGTLARPDRKRTVAFNMPARSTFIGAGAAAQHWSDDLRNQAIDLFAAHYVKLQFI